MRGEEELDVALRPGDRAGSDARDLPAFRRDPRREDFIILRADLQPLAAALVAMGGRRAISG